MLDDPSPNPINGLVNYWPIDAFDGKHRLTTETEYPGMTPNIEQTTDLASGVWLPAVGGVVLQSVGPVVVIEFPISTSDSIFYRGKRKP